MTRLAYYSWLLALPTLVGCGNGLSMVSGTVTLDGRPVECGPDMYGTVSFYRANGGGAPATGLIDTSGRYRLNTGTRGGVSPGSYVVAIAVKKVTPAIGDLGMPQPHNITPPKYADVHNSGLTAVVQPGTNTIDFTLEPEGEGG